ncbi:MAG TPA: M15 family metallopeptidase [Candidatus Saccharibacteria bacterium]|nr:M15 family metallopeptidase [Candidatus Saccharibacteria bacterium]
MSVYDPEKTEDKSLAGDNNISDDKLRELMGIHKDQEDAMDREAHNGAAEDIAKREKLGYDSSPYRAGKDEASKLLDNKAISHGDDNNNNSGFFKDTSNGKKSGRFRGKITKKQAAGGVAGILGIGGILGILMTASGPLAFVHMASLMGPFHHENNANMQDGRLTRLWRYARGNGIDNNLGAIGNKYAKKVDTRLKDLGITPNYSNKVLTSFTFDTDTPKGKSAFDELKAKGYSSSGDGRLKQIDAPRGFGSRTGIRTMTDDLRIAISEDGISNAITHRLSKKRYAGGFHPLQNFYREAGESIVDYTKSVKQHHDERVKTGVSAPDRAKPPPSQDQIDADTRDNIRRNAPDGLDADTPSGVKGKIIGAVAGTVGAVGLYELICNIDQIGGSMEAIRQAELVIPLMRIGLDGLALGSQVQFGDQDVTSDEMGALFTRFMGDTDIGKLSAFSADSIQAELGQDQIGERTATKGENEGQRVKPADLPASSKPGKENPPLFTVINDLINALPTGQTACDVLIDLNACVGSACIGVSDVLDGVVAFISGGASAAAASATVNAIFIGAGVLGSDYVDSLVNWLAGAALQCADGPQWGNCVNFGNRLNANDNALSFGGRELQPEEEIALDYKRKELERYDMKTKSLYARYLDPKETNSLFASSVFNNPNYFATSSTLSYGLQAPLKNFSNIFTNFGNIFGGKTKAASVDYDYGFPEYGFSLDEQRDETFENPYDIAKEMEKNNFELLKEMNRKYGEKCFKTTISTTGKIQTTEAVNYKDIPEKCAGVGINETEKIKLKKYRFYLSDTITAKSAVCYEGADESACDELGLPDQSKSSSTPGANGPLPDGVVTEADIEPVTGLSSGCHKSIAANANAMIAAAAADGVTLTGSCWRSNARQIQLRIINGCPDIYNASPSSCRVPTAIPGTSNHERGLAIDFDNCRSRGTACYIWLSANAATYGFFNLPSEPWHWSVNGR